MSQRVKSLKNDGIYSTLYITALKCFVCIGLERLCLTLISPSLSKNLRAHFYESTEKYVHNGAMLFHALTCINGDKLGL